MKSKIESNKSSFIVTLSIAIDHDESFLYFLLIALSACSVLYSFPVINLTKFPEESN